MTALERVSRARRSYGVRYVLRRGYRETLRAAANPLLNHVLRIEHGTQRVDSRGPNERPLEYAFALNALSLTSDQELLDIGPGHSAWPALVSHCGYHVSAIDEMSGYWRHRISNPHFHVTHDDITAPKTTKKFGVVTCLSTLEHITGHRDAVAGMASLLKPGGILILTHPYNEEHYVPNAYDLPEAAGYVVDPAYVCQVFNRDTLDGWLRDTGLELAQQRYWKVFTGDFWGCGEYLYPRQEVTAAEPHQLTGVVLRKPSAS